jgi:TRAP-type C4-dicarboxylate transport system permease small subunit
MIGRAFDRLLGGLNYVAMGLVTFMGASVLFEVFMRYLFNSPTRWVVEFSEYMLLYIGFLAGAWVLKHDGHVKIELVTEALPLRLQGALHTVTSLVGAFVCGLFCWYSATYTWEIFWTGEVLFRSVHVPKWAVIAVIPFGMLLLSLQFVRRAFVLPRSEASPAPERESLETTGL